MAKSKIGSIALFALNIGLAAFGAQLPGMIKKDWIRELALKIYPIFPKFANIFGDNDPNNDEQIEALFQTELPGIIDTTLDVTRDYAIIKVSDPLFQRTLEYHLAPTRALLKAAIDGDPNNNAQFKAILDKYKEGSVDLGFDHIIEFIDKKVSDPTAKAILLPILEKLKEEELTKTV